MPLSDRAECKPLCGHCDRLATCAHIATRFGRVWCTAGRGGEIDCDSLCGRLRVSGEAAVALFPQPFQD